MEKLAIYRRLCPNCYGEISDGRLTRELVCKVCLPLESDERLTFTQICNKKKRKGELDRFCFIESQVKDFKQFFSQTYGFDPYTLQLNWAKRFFMGESFTMIAPTGIGKTTFGIALAGYIKGKTYILLPTRLLVEDVYRRFEKAGINKKIVIYTGKKKQKEQIKAGDYDILITTTNFLYRNIELFENVHFSLVFVDDVDALLKSAKNIDAVFKLIGISKDTLMTALKIIDLKSQLLKKPDDQRIANRVKKLKDLLKSRVRREKRGQLIISSATAIPKSKRVKLFREILDFEIGKEATNLRNIHDLYCNDYDIETLRQILKNLKNGIFLFVSADKKKEFVKELKQNLIAKGFSCITYEEFTEDNRVKFEKGEIACVIGISSARNPLVRGLDLPFAVKYAVFYGVPKLIFPVDFTPEPLRLYHILLAINRLVKDERVREYIKFLANYRFLKIEQLEAKPYIFKKVQEIVGFLKELFSDETFLNRLKEDEEVSLKVIEGRLYLIIGDAVGYIQASGRTSRMYAGGLTKGLAIILKDDDKAFNSLKRRIEYMGIDIEFEELKGLKELAELKKEIEQEREKIQSQMAKRGTNETIDPVKTALMIVESPTKARTISNFFGKAHRRYILNTIAYEISLGNTVLLIMASKGHVFDLVNKGGIHGILPYRDYFLPVYDTIKYCSNCKEQTTEDRCPCGDKPDQDKIELVKALRELGYQVDKVFIATDPDTEGEKIAWDLENVFKVFHQNIERMEFHEITQKAILNALSNPRSIDTNWVEAQMIRRIADRWVGFGLSQVLWNQFNNRRLSAGRVQTPVLGWIIERAEKSKEKKRIITIFTKLGKFIFELPYEQPIGELKELVLNVKEEREEELIPPPPFNTSDLLKESSAKLGFSAQYTMQLAQELFENGLITYHRTDAYRVSDAGLKVAREFISRYFDKSFFKPRMFSKFEGAHECIRPTRPYTVEEIKTIQEEWERFREIGQDHLKLYDLILKRFIASQMKPVKVKKLILEVRAGDNLYKETERLVKILEPGFNLITPLKIEPINIEEKGEGIVLKIKGIKIRTVPKVLPYTQGELISLMKERGIGRPSTYAKIIEVLLKRRYVIEIKQRLYPTKLGKEVYDYLTTHFKELVSEELTREIEALQDYVETGKISYKEALKRVEEYRIKIEKRTAP